MLLICIIVIRISTKMKYLRKLRSLFYKEKIIGLFGKDSDHN
jgi:hypothetical protein